MSKSKSIILGIDGGDFQYIDPLIKDGKLNNINKIISSGVSTILESTYPPLTPIAWTTMLSGVTSAKHTISNWWFLNGKDYSLRPINSSDVKFSRIWDIFNK